MSNDQRQRVRGGSIRQRLSFLAKDSVLYGGAATLSKMLNLLILPVLTRLFSNAEYGALDVITVSGQIFVAFIIMGQDSAIARYYYEHEEESERRQIIAQAIVIELVLCLVVTLVGWFAAEVLLETVYGVTGYTEVFRLMVLSFPFAVALRFCSNLLRWTFARYQFVAVAFGSTAAIVALTILFVVGFEMGMRGIFLAQIIGNAIFAILGLYFCRHHFTWPEDFKFGGALLRYGIPYMVVAMATCLIPAIDRALISRYAGLDTLGSYAIGYRYAFMIALPVQAFFSAYLPFAFLIYKEPSAEKTYDRVLTLVVSGLCLIAIAMVAVAEPVITMPPVIELVASERYLPGQVAVLPILLALVVQAMAQVMGIGIDLSKKTHLHLFIRTVGIAGPALFMWLLIEPLGIFGVACGLLLGKIAEAIAFTACAYYVYPLRFHWRRPAAVILLAAISGGIMQVLQPETIPLLIASRIANLFLLSIMIWFVMLAKDDRAQALSVLRERFGRVGETGNS